MDAGALPVFKHASGCDELPCKTYSSPRLELT